jgi:hypothetical protein
MRADIHWIDDLPRGRLAIIGRPRAGDWLVDEISGWTAVGLSDVVSLLENDEVRELGLEQEAALSMKAGLSFERFPILNRGVPAASQARSQMDEVWAFTAEQELGAQGWSQLACCYDWEYRKTTHGIGFQPHAGYAYRTPTSSVRA